MKKVVVVLVLCLLPCLACLIAGVVKHSYPLTVGALVVAVVIIISGVIINQWKQATKRKQANLRQLAKTARTAGRRGRGGGKTYQLRE